MITTHHDNQATPQPAKIPRSKQPRKQATKNKTALRKRAKIVIKALADGDSVQAAGIKAGYAPTYANAGTRTLLQNPAIKDSFNAILDAAGVTDHKIAEKLHSLIDAKKAVVSKGKVIEVQDNTTQLNATTLAAKLKGHLVERTVNTNINLDVHPVDLSRWDNTETPSNNLVQSEIVDITKD